MIFRIRFAKYGVVKFIGHLDVMRYFQKAVRRSGLPIKYSQGFNPHQLMVFAQPLGVGVTSDGEYMDIETDDVDFEGKALKPERVAAILGSALTEGFEIVDIRQIPWQDGTKHPENAMSLVGGADYLLSLKDGYLLKAVMGSGINETINYNSPVPYLKNMMSKFLEKTSIIVSKKSKSGEREMDIKPYIYEASVTDNQEIPEFIYKDHAGTACKGIDHADIYTPGVRFFFRLAAGSAVNIKPELVLAAFLEYCEIGYEELAFQIHRINMFSDAANAIDL